MIDLQYFGHSLYVVDRGCLQYIKPIDKNKYSDARTTLIDGVYHVKPVGTDKNKGFYVVCPYCGALAHHGGKGTVKSNCTPRNNFIID